MKKTIYSILAVAAGVILASGCSKEINPVENDTTGEITLSASLPGEITKAVVDGTDNKKVNWSEGDAISVWGGENNKFTLSSGAGKTSAYFTGTITSGTAQSAMYPYSATATIDAGVITTNVPNTQTAPAGQFDPAASIIVGTISGSAITFHHALSYLKITAPSDVTNLIEITIESNGGVQLTGDAKFAAANGAFTATGTPCKYVTIKPSTGTFTASGIYYAAVIPGTYTGGLTVHYIYNDASNHKLVGKKKSNTTALTLSAGTAKLLGAADLSTCTTYDVAVQLWADGPYWATMNIGAATETDYGQYFAWGYTEGYVRNSAGNAWVLASDGTTSKEFNDTEFPIRETAAYQDAAAANWGTGWSVPTADQFYILANYDLTTGKKVKNKNEQKCSVVYVNSGTLGIRVTGKGDYASNSIFLPTADFGNGKSLQHGMEGEYGYYLSSVQYDRVYAYVLCFDRRAVPIVEYDSKYYGYPVRPVRSSL